MTRVWPDKGVTLAVGSEGVTGEGATIPGRDTGDRVSGDSFNLYEFPADYIGRKVYKHVEGHKRSIPAPYVYTGVDGRNHIRPEFGGDGSGMGNAATMIMRDIGEYWSPLDGSMVTSRSQHRDHMRAHGVIEVGNECMKQPDNLSRNNAPMGRAGYDIKRSLEQLRSR